MDNFDQESDQQQYANDSGLNVFLSKIYGYMALAVFVSAISAYLTMTVFAGPISVFIAQHQWGIWLLILLPIALTFIISFRVLEQHAIQWLVLLY